MLEALIALAVLWGGSLLLPLRALADQSRWAEHHESRWRRRGRPPADKNTVRVASFNVENLYRYRHYDPDQYRPHYVPPSAKAYREKLSKVARTIVKDLRRPEIIALQEVENWVETMNNGEDPMVINDLIGEIERQSGKRYRAAGASGPKHRNWRGISQYFLYDPERVSLRNARPDNPVLGARDDLEYNSAVRNPKPLNAHVTDRVRADGRGPMLLGRPELVGVFEVFRDGVGSGGPSDVVTVINTHQKAYPDEFKLRRIGQVRFKAHLVRDIHERYPDAKVLVTGDFNLDFHNPSHRAQLRPLTRLTRSFKTRPNLLVNLSERLGPMARSYVWEDHGELLDLMYASPSLEHTLSDLWIPHINSGREDGSSDHDPTLATFKLFD